MATLHIYLEGDESDLDFLRQRAVGAVEELIDEYDANLDDEVEVSWELDSGTE